jgi:nitroreductase
MESKMEPNADFASNETIRAIMGRRSVRKFTDRPVDPERIRVLLECGFAAPSSKNIRPCHFIRIDDKETLEKIGNASPEVKAAAGAPLAIAVCADVASYEKNHGLTDGTWMEDSSCAMMNILIAARALGMEGVWLQIVNRAERESKIPRILGVPEGVKLFALAVIGFSEVSKPPHDGADESRLHSNGW